jgi:hypothetical protein
MSRSHALLAALAAAMLTPPTPAQQPPFPTAPMVLQPSETEATANKTQPPQPSYNYGVLGRGQSRIPLDARGYDPSTRSISTAPAITINNTAPQGGGGGTPFMGGIGGWGGVMPNSMGYGYALQGMADYTRASGQYWNDIESARMSREKSRQEEFNTQRARLQYEMDYEKLRPTSIKMRDKARIDDLDWARNDPPNTQIWSGETFNMLLRSILTSSAPSSGPNISLEQNMVNGLNLRDKSARGNLSLAKDDKFEWPDALLEKPFDDMRSDFDRKYATAMKSVRYGERPDRTLLRELRADLDSMDAKLVQMVGDYSPTEFIDARRKIRTLTDTMRAMGNALTVKASATDWRRNVRTVADLVDYMSKNGLEFGPAVTPTDFSAYSAAYFPIRNFERGLIGSTTASSSK